MLLSCAIFEILSVVCQTLESSCDHEHTHFGVICYAYASTLYDQTAFKRRTGKVRRPKTDVLPLCHATNRRNAQRAVLVEAA